MEGKEIKQKFEVLYNTVATSNEPKYMNVFGETMKAMLDDMIAAKPELAQEYVEKLEAIEWNNYLTKKEAMEIVEGMNPEGGWSVSEWSDLIKDLDLRTEDSPNYNEWSLYAVMNMVYSDSAKSIAAIAGKPLEEMPEDEMFLDVHMLALDKLEDKDGMFDVREYFHV